MKSFSSAINKTGKKFAPKAPARRAPAAPARRPSVTQQSPAETPQPKSTPETSSNNEASVETAPVVTETERPAVTELPPPAVAATEPIQPPAPAPATAQTPVTIPNSSAKSTAIPKPTAISKPTPIPRTPISRPTPISKPTTIPKPTPSPKSTLITKPTSIPSPQKRKAQAVEQSEPVTTVPPTPPSTQPSPPVTTSANDSQTADDQGPEQALLDYARIEAARAAGDLVDSTEPQPKPSTQPTSQTTHTDAPPAKRAKKAVPIPKAKPNRKKSTSATPSASGSRRGSQSVVSTIEGPTGTSDISGISTPDPATKPKKRKYSKAEASDADGSEKPKRPRKKREPTPEEAEGVEILPNVMKMSELCKDLRTGRKSKREVELRRMEQEAEEKKKSGGGTPVKEPEPEKVEEPVVWKPRNGPRMTVVNGEIQLDNTSLQVDRHADAARELGELEDVEENSLTRKINSASFGKRSKAETWDEEMTELFYRGLRMFGTDFMVISKMFPGRSRRQIKLKFNNEERRDPQRIKDTLLGPREMITIAAYSEMTNTTYDDPKAVQQELDEEKKRIEEQHTKEQELQAELLRNPTGGDANDGKNDKAPVKKSRKKQVKSDGGGGTEEVLGSIDDIPTA
ncbi:hypothetical protein MYU51_010245 [Penicillium brevicompactum]